MDFAEFIAPMPADTFVADYLGRRPVQIRGASPRSKLLSTPRLQELLSVRPHWTADNLKLILNSRPVLGEHYVDEAHADRPKLADPRKVQLFLNMGASLVGDHVEEIDSSVRQAAAMLSEQFAATTGANVYCSFEGIRAFASHCDLHEVFAVQLEGEKTWQIYENRADAPVEALEGPDAQATIDRAKGPVMMTVQMQPGDLLYIPRGYFHDALASTSASLHLTFGVAPLNGRYLFRLLEQEAIKSPKFRSYLPDGRGDRTQLRAHLDELAEAIGGMMRSPLFETLLSNRQRALVMREHPVDLHDRRNLDYYAATGQRAQVDWRPEGAFLRHQRGEEPLGAIGEPIEWALEQQAFSREQLQTRYYWLSEDEAGRLIDLVTRAGLFVAYEPTLE